MANSYNYYDRSEKMWNTFIHEYLATKERKRKTWMQQTRENETRCREYEYVYSEERYQTVEELWSIARELSEYFALNVKIWYEEADGYRTYIEMQGEIYIRGDCREQLEKLLWMYETAEETLITGQGDLLSMIFAYRPYEKIKVDETRSLQNP